MLVKKGSPAALANRLLSTPTFCFSAGQPGIPSEANRRIRAGIHFATPSMSGKVISFVVNLGVRTD
jgi:hypothetical protein